jgi:hypothetical protein
MAQNCRKAPKSILCGVAFKKSLDLTPTLWSKLLLYHQYSEKKRIWQYGADFLAIFPVIFLVLSPAMWYTEKKRKEE